MERTLTAEERFHRLDEAHVSDWSVITAAQERHADETVADEVLRQLSELARGPDVFAVDRLTHSLQTCHRAEEDGQDEEYMLVALLHDIGDVLAPRSHPDLAAAILRPVVSDANHYMVLHHGTVQGSYFWHHIGLDRHAHLALRDDEHYERTVEFCAKYDMPSFEPDRSTPPLSYYEDIVRRAFRFTPVR